MRTFFFGLAIALGYCSQAVFAQSANSPPPPFFASGEIRLINASEEPVEPVQPESVFPPAARGAVPEFDGSASHADSSGGNAEGSMIADFCDRCDIGGWRDNTEIWAGADTFRSRGDGITLLGPLSPPLGNSFGAVAGFNTAFALGDSPIRGQIGASYGIYDWKGRYLPFSDASPEQQTFITLGVSKRSNLCAGDPFAWGIVFDQMFDHQWGFLADEIYLSQFRLLGSYAVNECNEVGVLATIHTQSDVAQDFSAILPIPIPIPIPLTRIRAMNQTNLFWRQTWEFGGTTSAYVGYLDAADVGDWLFGAQGTAPLNDYVSVYGNFTYVAPGSGSGLFGSSLEQWNASFGLTYSFGGKAARSNVSGPPGMPLLSVANNGSFLVTD